MTNNVIIIGSDNVCNVYNVCMYQPQWVHLSRTDEPAKVGTCARDRCALQQLALNVHFKQFDLT